MQRQEDKKRTKKQTKNKKWLSKHQEQHRYFHAIGTTPFQYVNVLRHSGYNRNVLYLTRVLSLSSKSSKCLRNHAKGKPLELPTEMPGVTFTVDDQCRQQYGNRARHCHKYKVHASPSYPRKVWCTSVYWFISTDTSMRLTPGVCLFPAVFQSFWCSIALYKTDTSPAKTGSWSRSRRCLF